MGAQALSQTWDRVEEVQWLGGQRSQCCPGAVTKSLTRTWHFLSVLLHRTVKSGGRNPPRNWQNVPLFRWLLWDLQLELLGKDYVMGNRGRSIWQGLKAELPVGVRDPGQKFLQDPSLYEQSDFTQNLFSASFWQPDLTQSSEWNSAPFWSLAWPQAPGWPWSSQSWPFWGVSGQPLWGREEEGMYRVGKFSVGENLETGKPHSGDTTDPSGSQALKGHLENLEEGASKHQGPSGLDPG